MRGLGALALDFDFDLRGALVIRPSFSTAISPFYAGSFAECLIHTLSTFVCAVFSLYSRLRPAPETFRNGLVRGSSKGASGRMVARRQFS